MQWAGSAMPVIKEYLTQTNRLTPEMNAGFETMKKYMPSLTTKEKKAMRAAVNQLAGINFSDLDPAKRALYLQYVRQLEQVVDYMDARSTMFPARQSDVRDKYMAENCEWIYNYTGRNKMMIWAHNEHIRKSSGSSGLQRMGMFLKESLKDHYYAMGFDFSKGQMRSYDASLRKNVAVDLPEAKVGSSGALFAQCTAANFVLDLKSASAVPSINSFLQSPVPSFFFGAAYSPGKPAHYVTHKLADTYDAVIFIRETSAVSDIKNATLIRLK